MDAVSRVHDAFRHRVAVGDLPGGAAPTPGLDAPDAAAMFEAQVLSRALDIVSREMQKAGQGFYTIGSSGHEGMAAVAQALRSDDIAFLHYRDAAFQIARAAQAGQDRDQITGDMLRSFACAADDRISGGRHKVLGSRALMIPPQTSTIASHLPKALGTAFGIGAARRARPEGAILPRDAIALASFGDASLNHSTAQGAINAGGWAVARGADLPLLLVCEDNGIGISVRTPRDWVARSLRSRPGLRYFAADGCDLYAAFAAAREAAAHVRRARQPAVLHLSMVRLYGHAGADVAETYLSADEIAEAEARDPLLTGVRLLRDAGALAPAAALELYDAVLERTRAAAQAAPNWRRLADAEEVMAPIVPPLRMALPTATLTDGAGAPPQPMVRHIADTLGKLMEAHPEIVLMGEDVGAKGGVYGATRGLQARFGPGRVIDTLLDEQTILGMAIGMAHNGFIPIPEIQFLAYLHNAEDQLRGEAATLPFFSNGQFANPMVVRIAGLGYQKGFGGHFHNDNSLAVLRDIPGLILACPSSGAEAGAMLRECVRLAREENRVSVFLEPIALYPMRDLHAEGDGLWQTAPADATVPLGSVGVHGPGRDIALISYGNGHYLCHKAAKRLADTGIAPRIVNLRWLSPLPEAALLDALAGCGAALVVDECRRSGNLSEALICLLAERTDLRAARLTAEDSFIATGPAHAATLPSVEGIVAAARALLDRA
ncbi:MFS transporter [Meridianimarinicoccus roseus]|uniref:2-oxoglutarate dehydrogenase E1 component n=1 Tax=Meridianimarinicoccus roseus TaxID=2072018 RepID=A0A2V2LK92_9RHOB|nr:thiamine pyrophosphate-dependent enzyme [Meridianimarinicoccus roseus]PWR03626.1 MFS transporter [Meridianimarinicoccus roseus]